MADIEKVIKESEEAIDILAKAEEPTFLLDFVRCAFENALELLKEQPQQEIVEPVKPIDVDDGFTWLCNFCNGELFCGDRIRDIYCPTCGRKINWNGLC